MSLQQLNEIIEIVSYDGKCQDGTGEYYIVQNVLKKGTDVVHCSGKGTNFNLILKAAEDVTVTHLVVFKAPGCTAPIKVGALHVYEDEPNYDDIKEKYNSMDAEESRQGDDPHVLFVTPEESKFVCVALNPWKKGRFFHVKFISPRTTDDPPNIDVGYVGLVGFKGDAPMGYTELEIPEEFGILPKKLAKFNVYCNDYLEPLTTRPTILMMDIKNAESAKNALKQVAETGEFNDLVFMYMPSDESFIENITEYCGFPKEDSIIVALDIKNGKKTILTKEATVDNIVEFCNSWKNDTYVPFVKSQERNEGDKDEHHPHIYKLTANSFKDLVVDSHHDFLVDIYADWCPPCKAVAPTIVLLSELFKDSNIRVGKMNSDYNDVDKKLFPESGIPNIKFFTNGKKTDPIKHGGGRDLNSFIDFIHDITSYKFDLNEYKKKGEDLTKISDVSKNAEKYSVEVKKLLEENPNALSNEEKPLLEEKVSILVEYLGSKNLEKIDSTNEALESLKSSPSYDKLKKADEIRKNKKVIKVHSEEEFNTEMEKAKNENKGVVIDFFAVWCGPCVYISPFFADLSEKYPNVAFIKVDVDQTQSVSEKYNIQCMPTFKVINKLGEVVNTLEGADIDTLEKYITELN